MDGKLVVYLIVHHVPSGLHRESNLGRCVLEKWQKEQNPERSSPAPKDQNPERSPTEGTRRTGRMHCMEEVCHCHGGKWGEVELPDLLVVSSKGYLGPWRQLVEAISSRTQGGPYCTESSRCLQLLSVLVAPTRQSDPASLFIRSTTRASLKPNATGCPCLILSFFS